MKTKLSAKEVAAINRNRIYNLIYREESVVTKEKIMQQLNLSRPTVEANLKALENKGLIAKGELADSTGGRKPVSYIPRLDTAYSIGLSISAKNLKIVILDIKGHCLLQEVVTWDFMPDAKCFHRGKEMLRQRLSSLGIEEDSVLGVGISIPGIVNAEGTEIMYMPTLTRERIVIADMMKGFDFETTFINDANAIGVCYHFFDELEAQNSVLLSIASGVGGFIQYGGNFYFGDTGMSGEFGHMVIIPEGKPCHCGKCGCLEAYVSTMVLSDELGLSLPAFFEKLDDGDAQATAYWRDYLYHLAHGVANIHTIFNCTVVINGEICKQLQRYRDDFDYFISKFISIDSKIPIYRFYEYNPFSEAQGSALVFVQNYIDHVS